MNEFGITPIEAAFEVIGLTNSYLLIDYLFKQSAWGMLAFGIGFLMAFSRFLKSNNFWHLISYMLLSFFIILLFISPKSTIQSISSTMENQAGYTQIKAQDIFNTSAKTREVPSVLLFISRCFNSMMIGAVNTINAAVGDSDYNYLKSPFLANKIMIEMSRFLHTDIKDRSLDSKLNVFIREEYLPTLNKMEEKGIINNNNMVFLWPGKDIVVQEYSNKGREEWIQLRADLIQYINANEKIKRHYDIYRGKVEKFIKSDPNQEEVVGDDRLLLILLNQKIWEAPKLITSVSGTKKFNIFDPRDLIGGAYKLGANLVATVLAGLGQFFSDFISRTGFLYFLLALPYLQGFFVLLLFSLFPATLIFMLITGQADYLFIFLKTLLYLKSWTIVLALITAASKFVIEIQARLSPTSSFLVEMPIYNAIVFSLAFFSPAISYIFVNGTLGSIGSMTSSIMGTGTKGMGMAEGKLNRLIGGK